MSNYAASLSTIGVAADAEVASLTGQVSGLTSDVARLGAQVTDLKSQLAAATAPPKPAGLGIPMPTTPPAGWGPSIYAEDFLIDVAPGAFPADGSGGPYTTIGHYQKDWPDSSGKGRYNPAQASVSGSVHTMTLKVVNGVAAVCALAPKIPQPFLYGRIDQCIAVDLPVGLKDANLLWGNSLPGETTNITWVRCGEIDMFEWDAADHFEAVVHHMGDPAVSKEVRTSPVGFDWRKPFVLTTEWRPGSVSSYINGKLMAYRTYPPASVIGSYVPNRPMHMVNQGETTLVPGIAVPANASGTIRTDWVQVWAYKP